MIPKDTRVFRKKVKKKAWNAPKIDLYVAGGSWQLTSTGDVARLASFLNPSK
jgi:hypothetical protein